MPSCQGGCRKHTNTVQIKSKHLLQGWRYSTSSVATSEAHLCQRNLRAHRQRTMSRGGTATPTLAYSPIRRHSQKLPPSFHLSCLHRKPGGIGMWRSASYCFFFFFFPFRLGFCSQLTCEGPTAVSLTYKNFWSNDDDFTFIVHEYVRLKRMKIAETDRLFNWTLAMPFLLNSYILEVCKDPLSS